VIVERTGRTAAVDLASGRPLWATELSRARVDTVHDAASGDGLVVIGGTKNRPPVPGGGLGRGSSDVVVVLDARTGEPMFEYEETSPIRWVRIGIDGRVLVGFEDGVACLDANRRSVVWRNDRPALAETIEGWSFPGSIVVRDFDSALYMVSATDGTGAEEPLPVADRLDAGVEAVRMYSIPGGNMVVATERGIALLNSAGALIGVDAGGFGQRMVMPAVADGAVVTVGSEGNPVSDAIASFRVNMYDTESVKAIRPTVGLELGVAPREVRVIDDRVLVGAGTVIAVIDAPAPKETPTMPPGVPGMNLPTPEGVPPVPVPMPAGEPEKKDAPQ